MQARSTDAPQYVVQAKEADDAIIDQALEILWRRITERPAMTGPASVMQYLILRAAQEADQHRERFGAMFLDSQNCVIAVENLFEGTLTQAAVYPREIVRAALRHNASAVILTHNHPSGNTEPSRADEMLTNTLKTTLDLIDVRVLDHIITSHNGRCVSMAERGLI